MKILKYVQDLLVVSSGTTATGEAATKTGPSVFVPSAVGCGMAHCDPQMSDNSHMIPPKGDLELAWADLDAAGDAWGLGCASNAKVTACVLGPLPGNSPYLRVYNPYGDMIWSYPLNVWTWTSSPLINDEGQVIAADNERLILFDSDGSIIWERELGGGLVISPVVTENGLLVFGTLDGVVMTLDPSDGSQLAEIRLTDMIDGLPGTFGSRNTPCVMGNRIYLSTEFKPLDSLLGDETRTGRLYAIEVQWPSNDVDATEDLIKVAWHVPYGSRSGSSPVCQKGLVYFDGDFPDPYPPSTSETNPHFFAVQDMGDYGTYVLQQPTSGSSAASAAADPRPEGGVWHSSPHDQILHRLAPASEETSKTRNPNGTRQGEWIETLDLRLLGFDNPVGIVLMITIGKNEDGDPVLMFCIREFLRLEESDSIQVEGIESIDADLDRLYHVGFDVVKQEVRYKAFLGRGNFVPGHAIVLINDEGERVLVLALSIDGVVAYKEKPLV